MSDNLLIMTDAGLYCPVGDFHIDPWKSVPRALITHAHADHARRGSARYLCSTEGQAVLRSRMGESALIDTLRYGEPLSHNGVTVSFHPAGHVLGSSQIRLEHQGRVWVVSGDYKIETDTTCTPFEPVRCDVFITESTFGLPIYRWSPQKEIFAEINAWWKANRSEGKASLLFGYALGKSQRLLSGLDPAIGPIYLHGALVQLTRDYESTGIVLPPWQYVGDASPDTSWAGTMVLAPPATHSSPWAKKFAPASTAMASGWMRIRGPRRRHAVDRGFVLSDHADWPGLLKAISETGAEQVWVTHGYVAVLVRHLREQGIDARAVQTRFEGEREDEGEAADG